MKLGGKFIRHGKVKEHFLVLDNNGSKLPHVVKLETWEPSKRWSIVFDNTTLKHITWNKIAGTSNNPENPRRNIHALKTQKDGARVGKVFMDTNWSGGVSEEYLTYRITCVGETVREDKVLIP